MALELTIQQWQAGQLRAQSAPAEQQRAVVLVVDEIVAELRRRLGGPFKIAELAALYEQGTAWCSDIAYKLAPGAPAAWDPRTTADAAFARYLRAATDYAGGRQI